MTDATLLLEQAPAMLAAGEHERLGQELSALCEREPDNARAHFLLGAARHAQGRLADALEAFERSVTLNPRNVQAVIAIAGILHALGHVAAADERFALAMRDNPDAPDLLVNHAVVLEDLGRPEDALRGYRRALAVQPDHPRALQNLPVLLFRMGRAAEALSACDRLLALYPDHVEGHANRGNLLLAQRDYDAALAASTRAVALAPDHARAHADRALALAALGHFDASREAARRAVSLLPDVMRTAGGDKDAPDCPDPRVVYLLTAHERLERCDWHDFERQGSVFADVAADPKLQVALADQMALLARSYALPVQPALRARLGRSAGNRIAARATARVWLGAHEGGENDRIRIGYLSGDFRLHPGAMLLLPVLRAHDRTRFEVTAYATNADDGSGLREQLRGAVDRFVELHDQDDHDAAWRICESGCDVLVFHDGYTQLGRPGILAQRPAPLQITWAGYHGTIGGGMADYHVSDAVSDPTEDAHLWDEARLFLPFGPLPFPHATTAVAPPPPRALLSLPEDALVLAALHRPEKLDPELFDVWMRLLAAIPRSVLWLLDDQRGVREALQARAASRDVDPGRLVFCAQANIDDHLRRLRAADIWLDTRWYGSHTTLLDALAAAVPAVTCTGNAVHGRLGSAIVAAAGLSEQVTHCLEDYQQAVLRLATDTAERQRLRAHLLARRAPLFDTTAFVRTMEDGYERVWHRHRRALPPCDTLMPANRYQRFE